MNRILDSKRFAEEFQRLVLHRLRRNRAAADASGRATHPAEYGAKPGANSTCHFGTQRDTAGYSGTARRTPARPGAPGVERKNL